MKLDLMTQYQNQNEIYHIYLPKNTNSNPQSPISSSSTSTTPKTHYFFEREGWSQRKYSRGSQREVQGKKHRRCNALNPQPFYQPLTQLKKSRRKNIKQKLEERYLKLKSSPLSLRNKHNFPKENKNPNKIPPFLLEHKNIQKDHQSFKKFLCEKEEEKKKFSINDFKKIRKLGAGSYGHVYLVKEKKTNLIYALKVVEKKFLKENSLVEQFTRELKIQTFISHPNVIKTYGFFDDQSYVYIIMEAINDGQLQDKIKNQPIIPEKQISMIMQQICEGVSQLHSHRIIHRDLKPQNILLHENVVKICDFGWSVHMNEELRSTFCGTPLYLSPEILKREDYDEKVDIWSLGVMMYEMVIGDHPFHIRRESDMAKIVLENMMIPSFCDASEESKNFIQRCLQKDGKDRPQIKQLLDHEFIRKFL